MVSFTDTASSTTYSSPSLYDGVLLDEQAGYGTLQYKGSGTFDILLSGLGDESCAGGCSLNFLYTGATATTQNYEVVDDPGLSTQQIIDQSFSITTPGSFGINLGAFGTEVTFQFLDPSYQSTNYLSATFDGTVTIPQVNSDGTQATDPSTGNPLTQTADVSASLAGAPQSVPAVPEPSSIAFLSTGLVVLATRFRKQKK